MTKTNIFREHIQRAVYQRLVTFETYDQSDDET